jgi:hypothetical protein
MWDERIEAQLRTHASCGVRWSSQAAELVLGVEASDASVDLGSLLLVDPLRRYPFRQSIWVHLTCPAFLQEVGVVIPA